MRKMSIAGALTLALSTFVLPQASAVSSGNCNVSTASSSGVILVNSGGYCYLAFSATGSNSFTVPSGVTSSAVLVVAGGGAGGAGAWGGGGGAGGVLYGANYPLTPGATLNISVGAGGLSGSATTSASTNRSNNGGDSWINSSSTFVAKGGGAGASFAYYDSASYAAGSAGGSGGGGTENSAGGAAGASTQTLPTYGTTIYGNAGGSTPAVNNTSGGGGGGAGAAGTPNSVSSTGGAGGAGTSAFSSWFIAIGQFGVNGFIAGGGGGGTSTNRGNGGSGGGGIGADQTHTTAGNGVANTGSGGGGATYVTGPLPAGNGGSGLIIFKYAEVIVPASINTPSLSSVVSKGNSTTITVTMDSPGRVEFLWGKKSIGGCVSVVTSGSSGNYSATCYWKPAVTGASAIRAKLTPSNLSQAPVTSAAMNVIVTKRTNRR